MWLVPPVVDGNAIPNIATRYIRTTVSAPQRRHDCLGGLIMDNNQDNRNWNTDSRSPPVGWGSFPEHNQVQNANRTDYFDAARSVPDEIGLVSPASKERGPDPFRP